MSAGERGGRLAGTTSGGFDFVAGPTGRPRQRGVRRVRRDVTLDGPVVERVEQLASLEHGGNFSAALQAVVERGLYELAAAGLADWEDAAERLAAATAEVDRLTRFEPAPCGRCGSVEHIGGNCPRD